MNLRGRRAEMKGGEKK